MALSPEAQRVYEAFWAAADRLAEDDSVHAMEQPYFDREAGMVDGSGAGIPGRFWEHLAATLTVPPRKVWAVLGMEDDGTSNGWRYLSAVFDTPEKAQAYAEKGWALDVDEAEVQ